MHLESKGLLHPALAGFRKNRSTEKHVTMLSQTIKDKLDKSNIVGAVFVDFKGAYDTVWRTKLLHKLAMKRISGRMLRWFSDFLTQRHINVATERHSLASKLCKRVSPKELYRVVSC